jgi:hypothetical protein
MDAYHLLFADGFYWEKRWTDKFYQTFIYLFIYFYRYISLLQLAIYSTLKLCNTLIFSQELQTNIILVINENDVLL